MPNQPVYQCIHCLVLPGLEQQMPDTDWAPTQSTEQCHMIAQSLSSVTAHNWEFWFQNLVHSSWMHPLHTSRTKGAMQIEFWSLRRAELTCGEQMLIWQSSKSWRTSTFSIEFWNRLWKRKKFRWSECLTEYRTPKAFYKPGHYWLNY